MSVITPQQFEMLLPLAGAWAAEQERIILQSGVPLTEPQLTDARQVGVIHTERVRLLRVVQIPAPSHPVLARAAAATGLISPTTGGMTLRYGIFIRTDCWGQRLLVAHELVHTSQYERLGGFEAFLRPYLFIGVPHSARLSKRADGAGGDYHFREVVRLTTRSSGPARTSVVVAGDTGLAAQRER